MYNFSLITISSDLAMGQIKALKQCDVFKKKPYVITCLFHFSQAIIKKII